jgi:hypothetical protein
VPTVLVFSHDLAIIFGKSKCDPIATCNNLFLEKYFVSVLKMPAGKTKTANGSATPSKQVSRSGTATPVSTIASQDLAGATLTGGKPDKKAYDAEQEAIKAELDSLHAKLVSNALLCATSGLPNCLGTI